MICGHGHEQKFRYPYPRDTKKIQLPNPRAKAIDQNPTLCPESLPPPRRLDIDRCIKLAYDLVYKGLGKWEFARNTGVNLQSTGQDEKVVRVAILRTEVQENRWRTFGK